MLYLDLVAFLLRLTIFTVLLLSAACGVVNKQPLREESTVLTHTVKFSGETLSVIALWYTGKTSTWKEIVHQNPKLDAGRLRIGDRVMIPIKLIKQSTPLTLGFVQKNRSKQLFALSAGLKGKAKQKATGDSETSSPKDGEAQRTAENSIPDHTTVLQPSSTPAEVKRRKIAVIDDLLD